MVGENLVFFLSIVMFCLIKYQQQRRTGAHICNFFLIGGIVAPDRGVILESCFLTNVFLTMCLKTKGLTEAGLGGKNNNGGNLSSSSV